MIDCPKCKGSGELPVTVHTQSKTEVVVLKCVYCDGVGQITPEQKAQMDYEKTLWCRCGEDHGQDWHDDGEGLCYKHHGEDHGQDWHDDGEGLCYKHHCTCRKCGLITQVG
jgi:hypothetical protein